MASATPGNGGWAMGTCLVPYGGWVAAKLQPGESVLVSGATGNFGSAAVAVALAMGAPWVVAPGRNEAMLADLVRRFGKRVLPVQLTGNEAEDRQRMLAAAPKKQPAPKSTRAPTPITPPSSPPPAQGTAADDD